MQPYFFPYLGYFDIIHKTDRWIVFDVVQFTPKSWMTRNRVFHPKSGWQYIKIPVEKHERFEKIQNIIIIDPDGAGERIERQVEHYRKKAPYFDVVRGLIGDAFSRRASDSLVDVNTAALAAVCDLLGVPFKYEIFSRMAVDLPDIDHPGQWALEISHAVGADTYINPPGGRDIFKPEEFRERGIELGFTRPVSFQYDCNGYEFIPYLSILDVLMWNSPQDIKVYLDGISDAVEYV
jgi:hypothetical protein